MSRYDGQTAKRYTGASGKSFPLLLKRSAYALAISAKARKLKSLTVDKGLLREVREVQKMVNAVTMCKVSTVQSADTLRPQPLTRPNMTSCTKMTSLICVR